jgi:ribose-phosphate pyrophosphokinase
LLFAGSASRSLGGSIAEHLSCDLGASESIRFSEGNLFVRVLESVRGRDALLVQAGVSGERQLHAVAVLDRRPQAGQRRLGERRHPLPQLLQGDKKDEPRVSIRARVCADAIEAAGADRVVTLDLHAPQVQGFFRVPVDDLHAMPVLRDAIAAKGLEDLVVVAPAPASPRRPERGRTGSAHPARSPTNAASTTANRPRSSLIGSVEGRTALIVDDSTISGGTLVDAARVLVERGPASTYAAVTHGLLAGPANQRLEDSPIEPLFMTNSVETQPQALSEKVEVLSVAGLFGEAVRRIAHGESIFVLFE